MDYFYAGLCFAQFFTFVAYIVVSAGKISRELFAYDSNDFLFFLSSIILLGAALLQYRANNLVRNGFDFTTETSNKLKALDPTNPNAGGGDAAYNGLFTRTTYIIGYNDDPKFQFQYEWWIIEFEFFIFAMTAFLTLFPKHIPRGRIVALTFMATAMVLVMDNINAIRYVKASTYFVDRIIITSNFHQ